MDELLDTLADFINDKINIPILNEAQEKALLLILIALVIKFIDVDKLKKTP